MRDEIDRARKLSLANLEAPYFVEYTIDEQETFTVTATLGGILTRRRERFRAPDVHIRVGDYKFDNGNFAGGFGGGSRYDLRAFSAGGFLPAAPPVLLADDRFGVQIVGGSDFAEAGGHAQHAAERAAQRFRACRAGEIGTADQTPGDRRRAVGRSHTDAVGDFRAVSRDQELRGRTGAHRGRLASGEFRGHRSTHSQRAWRSSACAPWRSLPMA